MWPTVLRLSPVTTMMSRLRYSHNLRTMCISPPPPKKSRCVIKQGNKAILQSWISVLPLLGIYNNCKHNYKNCHDDCGFFCFHFEVFFPQLASCFCNRLSIVHRPWHSWLQSCICRWPFLQVLYPHKRLVIVYNLSAKLKEWQESCYGSLLVLLCFLFIVKWRI